MNISPKITQLLGRSVLQVQKHSPVIMTATGVVALLGAGVLAAKATLKLDETLSEAENRLDRAKALVEAGTDEPAIVTRTVVHNALQIGKLYWQPATLAIGGTVLVLVGHHILHQRHAAVVAAYAGLESAFKNYRQRVIEKYGEEVDKEIRYGIHNDKVVQPDGKKKAVTTIDRDTTSEYIFDFGPSNQNWVGNYEHNLFFLTGHTNIFNDLLRSRGHLFLSEVLDGLGIERTPASIVTGWIYDPKKEKDPNHKGDNFVDLGIVDLWETHGYILLDINVDGTIYDKI